MDFNKGGLPIQDRRLKFRSPEQYPKRENQLDPTGVQAQCFGG